MNDVEGDITYIEPGYEVARPPISRTTPSEAVNWAWEQLQHRHLRLKEAVDVGCGRGRNSFFLARKGFHVTALDFAPNAVEKLAEEAAKEGLGDKIRPVMQDVAEPWPVANEQMDLVVDAFCFKHLGTEAERAEYKKNLLRALGIKGHYLISLGSIGDGYYGRYIHKKDEPDLPVSEAFKIDPYNGIESAVFTQQAVMQFFKPELEVEKELLREIPADVAGKPPGHEVYAILFRRYTPKWS